MRQTDREQLRSHCVIADLPEFIKKAQEEAYKKGNLNKGQMERNRVQNPPMIQPPAAAVSYNCSTEIVRNPP